MKIKQLYGKSKPCNNLRTALRKQIQLSAMLESTESEIWRGVKHNPDLSGEVEGRGVKHNPDLSGEGLNTTLTYLERG
jgi:hypothetical protein